MNQAYPILVSSVQSALVFQLVSSTGVPITGVTPTVQISKNGNPFVTPAGAITEIGNGYYKVAANVTDTGMLGPLVLHASGTGSVPSDDLYIITANDPLGVESVATEYVTPWVIYSPITHSAAQILLNQYGVIVYENQNYYTVASLPF